MPHPQKPKRKSTPESVWQHWYREYILFEQVVVIETPLDLHEARDRLQQINAPLIESSSLPRQRTILTMTTTLQGRFERQLGLGSLAHTRWYTLATVDFVLLPDIDHTRIESEAVINGKFWIGLTALLIVLGVVGLGISLPVMVSASSVVAAIGWALSYRARNHLIHMATTRFDESASPVADDHPTHAAKRLSERAADNTDALFDRQRKSHRRIRR